MKINITYYFVPSCVSWYYPFDIRNSSKLPFRILNENNNIFQYFFETKSNRTLSEKSLWGPFKLDAALSAERPNPHENLRT